MLSIVPLIVSALLAFEPPTPRPVDPKASGASTPNVAEPATVPDLSPQVTEGIVKAPCSELWNVFTTSDGFKKLGVAKAEIDFRVGGLMRSHYDPKGVIGDEGTIQNQIIAYEPMRMLAFRIHQPPKGFPFPNAWKNTWSVVTFTDLGDGTTHIRLAGVGYDATEESQKMRDFFRTGNAWVLNKLQSAYDTQAPGPKGPAHGGASLDPIEKEIILPVARRDAWMLFSTGEGWKKMIADDAEIGLTPGGKFEIHFNAQAPKGEQGSEGCNVLSFVPGEMLSFTWNAPPQMAFARTQRTWVVIRFDELTPTSTRVRLTHMGFSELSTKHPEHAKEFEDCRAYFDVAWGSVLKAAIGADMSPK